MVDGWERREEVLVGEKKGQVRRPDEKGLVTTYGAGEEQAQRALVENWVLERKKNEVN